MAITTPTPTGYDQTELRSRLAFHWRVGDLSLAPITGQASTFSRSGQVSYTDQQGESYSIAAAHDRPGWDWLTTTGGDTVPTLGLDSNVSLYWTFELPPRSMTIYVRTIEQGTEAVNNARIIHLGSDSAGADPHIWLYANTGTPGFGLGHDNGTTAQSSELAASPSNGDEEEFRAVIKSDGSTELGLSLNGGAESTATNNTTVAFLSAWAGQRLYVNSGGTSDFGTTGLREVKIAPGDQSLAYMRSAF